MEEESSPEESESGGSENNEQVSHNDQIKKLFNEIRAADQNHIKEIIEKLKTQFSQHEDQISPQTAITALTCILRNAYQPEYQKKLDNILEKH